MAVVSLGLLGVLTNPRPNENRTQEREFLHASEMHCRSENHFTRDFQSLFPPRSEPRLEGRLGLA